MLHDGEPAVYVLPNLLSAPAGFEGWWGGNGLTLTSDFNAGSGRIDGGDFYFEIVSIEGVSGAQEDADFAWGESHGGVIEFSARFTGATRAERSYYVGFGSHPHGQVYASSHTGMYDVGLVAWDQNGVYADSQPLYVRVMARLCDEDLDADGAVNLADLSILLAHFGESGTAHPQDGDIDGDHDVDLSDLSALLVLFGGGCP